MLYFNIFVKNVYVFRLNIATNLYESITLKKNYHLSSSCVIVKKKIHNYLKRLLKYYFHFKLYVYVRLFFHIFHISTDRMQGIYENLGVFY